MNENDSQGESAGSVASPPCSIDEVDPVYMGLAGGEDEQQRREIKSWRKSERARLIRDRTAINAETRHRDDPRIADHLEATIGDVDGKAVAAYWPFRGEPNLRPLLARLNSRGAQCALPVVVAYGQPLVFRAWSPGEPLDRGVWNIPIPRESAAIIIPDVVIAPVVGYDRACYRLGFGGGFYDRTLAALPARPQVFGVGYAQAAISTIHPQWHDIPMDAVVTEGGVVMPRPALQDGAE